MKYFENSRLNSPSVWRSQLEYSDWLRLTHLNMSTSCELTRDFELTYFDRELEHADKDFERKHELFDRKNFRVEHWVITLWEISVE